MWVWVCTWKVKQDNELRECSQYRKAGWEAIMNEIGEDGLNDDRVNNQRG